MIARPPKNPNLDAIALGLGIGMWILEWPRFQAITKFWYTDQGSASLLSVNGSQNVVSETVWQAPGDWEVL